MLSLYLILLLIRHLVRVPCILDSYEFIVLCAVWSMSCSQLAVCHQALGVVADLALLVQLRKVLRLCLIIYLRCFPSLVLWFGAIIVLPTR